MSELVAATATTTGSAAAGSAARATRRRGRTVLDGPTLLLTSAIVLLGLIMVTSASITFAGRAGEPFAFLERQLSLAVAGCAAAVVTFCVPTESWQKVALPLLLVAGALLIAVLIPGVGHVVNGSRRWLRVGGLSFQVSEAARVLALIYVAGYAVRYEEPLRRSAAALVRPLALLALLALLLLLEPDFGAASVLFVSGFALLFLAGARLRFLLLMLLAAGGSMALLVRFSPYRLHRFMEFLNPWADPFNGGFQLTQSLIAIGRGAWFGVGLGASVQKLFYLPEAHTDFLFAVLAEELGLAGVALTLALFLALTWRAFVIARRAFDVGLKFASYLASGFGLWLGVQAFINIGVNMGVLPTKGLTLPFMSYGRSSLIVTLAWLGILLRVNHEAVHCRRRATREGSV
ncbi:MAG TPA: putative lipid II flippase FtsW [Steroidobacteraceae bacterium]|jgi:cell division protein FtsW|nr:putative lipid II flippase FtsW [Steroidobacteraceae bacterium]